MGAVLQIFASVETVGPCYKCGVEFAMPPSLIKNRREDKGEFFCPNGHSQVFGKTTSDLLREELAVQKAATERAHADAQRQRERREAADRQAAAARGQVTKMRNRIGNGVCPCCNRTFQNVMRHMATKHPEFKEPES